MKNKTIIITSLLIISLFLSGCIGTFGKKENPITDIDVYKGTNGLEIEFLKNSPPESIFEGESFQVTTILNNKGAYPINNGTVVLTNEIDYVEAKKNSDNFALKGKEMYDPSNHDIIKDFSLKAIKIDPKSYERNSIILVTACYDYGTKLNTEVCIDTDPYNQKIVEKPCQIKDLSFSGQGAPIAVTKVITKMLVTDQKKIRPQFQIYIRNDGNGQVISKNGDTIKNACGSNSINRSELNGVILKDLRFSEYNLSTKKDLDCMPDILRLSNKEEYFVCTLKPEKAIEEKISTFKTNLYIELEYGYTTTKSKEFKIKKLV